MPECDPEQCVLPACYCSADGTLAPGVTEDGTGLDITQVTGILPQRTSPGKYFKQLKFSLRMKKENLKNPFI